MVFGKPELSCIMNWLVDFEIGQAKDDLKGLFQLESEKERIVANYMSTRYDNRSVVIFGHVDEIPAREDVWRIANCETSLPGNFALWFPYGNLDFAFQSDFPAKNKPWTLGDPGVTWADAPQQIGLPRGKFHNVLGRGFHASNYCFAPEWILKRLTATEYRGLGPEMIELLRKGAANAQSCSESMQTIRLACLEAAKKYGARYRKVNDLIAAGEDRNQFYIPFALKEAPSRYPGWNSNGNVADYRAVIVPRQLSTFV